MTNATPKQVGGIDAAPTIGAMIFIAVCVVTLCLAPGTTTVGAEHTTMPPGPFEFVGKVPGACAAFHSPYAPDNSAFVTQTADDAVRVWNSQTLKPLSESLRHEKLAFYRLSADGKTLMTAGGKEVRLWDVTTSRLRSATKVADGGLHFADLSPNGARFLTVRAEDQRTLSVWEPNAERPLFTVRNTGPILSAEFSPNDKCIVTDEYGFGFRVWAADTGREVRPAIRSDSNYYAAHRAQFDAAGDRLLVPRRFGFLIVEVAADKTLIEEKFKGAMTEAVRFIAGDKKVALSLGMPQPGPVRIYDGNTGTFERELVMGECQTGPDGRWALGQSLDQQPLPEVWNLTTGTKVQILPRPLHVATSLHFMSPDGAQIVVESEYRVTSVWHLRKGLPPLNPKQ